MNDRSQDGIRRSYDAIVVGGGAAGCVLAARLSESPSRTVLLLEAGRGDRPAQLRGTRGVTDPDFLWAYDGLLSDRDDRSLRVVRGRGLGGSGAVNGVSCVRGIPDDYNAWRSTEWAWPLVLDAFKRLETDTDFGGEVHGGSGPIPIRRHPVGEWGPLDAAFFEAARSWGFPEQADVNHPDRNGIGPMPRNMRDGIRVDTAIGYLEPALDRPNLTVAAERPVRRVVFEGARAVGVELERRGATETVQADAVILAAGAIASPHLLFSSGIGPADELRALGLPVIADLPGVGKEIQDHPTVTLALRPIDEATPGLDSPAAPLVVNYTASGSPFGSDMQLMLISSSPEYAGAPVGLVSFLNRPVGRGELSFVRTAGVIRPVVRYRYLEEPLDRERAREGIRIAIELTRTEPFATLLAAVDGPEGDDRALDAWIARNVATAFHTVASCRLGPASDRGAVVDERCRVHGIDSLYVADLSIAPHIVRANTFGTAVMIGERAAQLIARP